MSYDRQLLLAGAKRNAVLELSEVQRYGTDSYGNADYVAIYGLSPAAWYARGIRLLGRTVVECTRDGLGDAIAKDVSSIAASAPQSAGTVIVDLFAGSGNTLFWLLRRAPGARGVGFESDPTVFKLTRDNLGILELDIEILNSDYLAGLRSLHPAHDQLLVMFIAPPWGDALSKESGLNLRRTDPPIADIVEILLQQFPLNRLLFAIQAYERVEPDSLRDLQQQFDWSALRVYGLNAPGENHGVLLGTKGWSPKEPLRRAPGY